MKKDIQLSASQEEAVRAPWRHSMFMILSTAGSGKTLVLTRRTVRIAEDILRSGLKNERILCLCFNLAMADEMHARIGAYLQNRNLAESIFVTRGAFTTAALVTIEVRTFHSFGLFILHSALPHQRKIVGAPQQNFKILQGSSLRKVMYDALKRSGHIPFSATEKSAKSKVSKILKEVENIKCRQFDVSCENILRNSSIASDAMDNFGPKDIFPEFEVYERQLLTEGALDLNDLLWKAVRLVLKCSEIRDMLSNRYVSVLVDEFQDVSAAQLFLCRTLVEKSQSLCLIGDDDQQIYSWRSSNMWFCHKIANTVFPPLKIIMLPENRRCPGNVVVAAYAVISRNSDRAPKEITAIHPKGTPVRVIGCESDTLEKQFVVRSVRSLQKSDVTGNLRILILFRTNELLNMFEDAFDDANVPTTRAIHVDTRTQELSTSVIKIFALITLSNPSVDMDSFVQAVCILSPTADPRRTYDVLSEAEAIENDERVQRAGEESNRRKPFSHRERFSQWYSTHRWSTDPDYGYIQSIHIVAKALDEFYTKICSARSMVEILSCATNIVESTFSKAPDEFVEDGDKTHTSKRSCRNDSSHNILIKAAEKVDTISRRREEKTRQMLGQPIQKISTANMVGAGTNDDLDDFSVLFASDAVKITKKRRRAQGVGEGSQSKMQSPRNLESIERDLGDLCATMQRKLGSFLGGRFKRQRLSKSESDIVLSTVHNAKGSTFDYVYLCGASKYNFPHGVFATGVGNQPLGQDIVAERQGLLEENNAYCQEERRLFFVAMTRTTKQLTCTYSGEGRNAPPKKFESLFIREMMDGTSKIDADAVIESFVFTEKCIDELIRVDRVTSSKP